MQMSNVFFQFIFRILLSLDRCVAEQLPFPPGIEPAGQGSVQGDPELQQGQVGGKYIPPELLFLSESGEHIQIIRCAVEVAGT